MIILSIIYFFGILGWDISSDYKKWKKDIPINHTKDALLRILLLLPAIIGLSLHNFSILMLLIATTMVFSWWWELFDGIYNKIRGLSWRYNGSFDPDDSKLDTFLYHLNTTQETLLKWGLILLSTSGYILISLT